MKRSGFLLIFLLPLLVKAQDHRDYFISRYIYINALKLKPFKVDKVSIVQVISEGSELIENIYFNKQGRKLKTETIFNGKTNINLYDSSDVTYLACPVSSTNGKYWCNSKGVLDSFQVDNRLFQLTYDEQGRVKTNKNDLIGKMKAVYTYNYLDDVLSNYEQALFFENDVLAKQTWQLNYSEDKTRVNTIDVMKIEDKLTNLQYKLYYSYNSKGLSAGLEAQTDAGHISVKVKYYSEGKLIE